MLSSLSGPAHIIESYKAQFKIIDEFKKTFLPSTKQYVVSTNVATVLGRDVARYETFHGAPIQHTLHAETVGVLNNSAELVVNNASEFATKAGNAAATCADKAYALNSVKEVQQGFDWVNLGKFILRCSEGAVVGLYKGSFELGVNMASMALNPMKTAKSLVVTIYDTLSHPQESVQNVVSLAQMAIDFAQNFDVSKAIKGYFVNLWDKPETVSESTIKTLVQFIGNRTLIQPLRASIQNSFSLSKLAHAITNKIIPHHTPSGLANTAKAIDNFNKKLSKMFDSKIKSPNSLPGATIKWDKKPLLHNLNHYFKPEIKYNAKTGKYIISGLHHDYKGKIKSSGVLNYSDIQKYGEHGFYSVKISLNGSKPKESTFFPDSWSSKKVMRKIHEAYNNQISTPVIDGGRVIIRGRIREGIDIKIVLEALPHQNFQPTGKIITVYPILK